MGRPSPIVAYYISFRHILAEYKPPEGENGLILYVIVFIEAPLKNGIL